MSDLLAARTALAAALVGDEWETHKSPPDDLVPPCLVVQPAENYLQVDDDAATFGGPTLYLVTVEVYAISDLASGEEAIDTLDRMQEFVVASLPSGWWLESTGQPDVLNNGDWQAYGNRLTVQTQLTIEKEVTP